MPIKFSELLHRLSEFMKILSVIFHDKNFRWRRRNHYNFSSMGSLQKVEIKPKISKLFLCRAKNDVQFIVQIYYVNRHTASYKNKFTKGTSNPLRQARTEFKKGDMIGNLNGRKRLVTFSSEALKILHKKKACRC